jgi:hypothetical protein
MWVATLENAEHSLGAAIGAAASVLERGPHILAAAQPAFGSAWSASIPVGAAAGLHSSALYGWPSGYAAAVPATP